MNRDQAHREPSSETPFDGVLGFIAELVVFTLLVVSIVGVVVVAYFDSLPAGTR